MFGFIEKVFAKRWLNPLYTLYLNFRLCCFKHAIHLPIYVYGWPKIYSTSGEVRFEGTVKRGMVKINPLVNGRMAPQAQPVELYIAGKVSFKGKCVIRAGSIISVRPKAFLSFGYDVRICEHCRICCSDSAIEIGDFASISHFVQIVDSSFHYMADFNNYIIPRKSRPVKIGNYCWICHSSSIAPGTILPDYTIVASNSIANKDYTNLSPMSLIGGMPAKLLKTNVKRVWYEVGHSSDFHKSLDSFFYNNKAVSAYEFGSAIKPEDLDIKKI